jgi:hypothetical protein
MENYIFPDTVGVPFKKDANPKVRKQLKGIMKEYLSIRKSKGKEIRAHYLEGQLKGLFAIYCANHYIFDEELIKLGVKDLIAKLGNNPSHQMTVREEPYAPGTDNVDTLLNIIDGESQQSANFMQKIYDSTGHYVKTTYEFISRGHFMITIATIGGGLYVYRKLANLFDWTKNTVVNVYQYVVEAIKKGFNKVSGWVCVTPDPVFAAAC